MVDKVPFCFVYNHFIQLYPFIAAFFLKTLDRQGTLPSEGANRT
jgi:hypothetical protein